MASLAAERLVDTLQQSFGALALLQNHLKAVEQRRARGIPWDPLGSGIMEWLAPGKGTDV